MSLAREAASKPALKPALKPTAPFRDGLARLMCRVCGVPAGALSQPAPGEPWWPVPVDAVPPADEDGLLIGQRVILHAADGYPLVATRFAPNGRPRAQLVLAGAIGVPQRFYRHFARFAARRGYAVMTLDYRGIGASAPETLRGFRMDCDDWGRFDLAAAVDTMYRLDRPLYVVAHSFGGQAIGLLPNHYKVRGVFTFGTGAGWHGWMPWIERLKVMALWHLAGPLLTRWKGYLPWSLLGMGEDLPLDFYRHWKQWCRHPNYFFGEPSMRRVVRDFAYVRAPFMAANAVDDRWSPPRSRDAFMAGYRSARRDSFDIKPGFIGVREIGHMGYFRQSAAPLWECALAWFEAIRQPQTGVSRTQATGTQPPVPPVQSGPMAGPTYQEMCT